MTFHTLLAIYNTPAKRGLSCLELEYRERSFVHRKHTPQRLKATI